ncbi:MAG: 50S ribosomal protein L4 [Candidatus Saganbacteria bacterium]|nr:50S ribosomal protein L4 [Candidatus Saganbacteria bacterium]
MVNLKVFTKDGKEKGEISAEAKVFSAVYKDALIHMALRCHRAGLRRGTQSTLSKAEVRGGGRKPWKQKGTGRARVGSIRSPLWRGGGVIFAPKPRDHSFNMPKKMRKAALRAVISNRMKEGRVKVIEDLSVSGPKTKQMINIIKGLDLFDRKILMLVNDEDKNLILSGRNIEKLVMLKTEEVNIFDLLNCEWLVLQKEILPKLTEALVK